MKVVALISGGKDSCYNMMECVKQGHEIVALANLHPPLDTTDEMDSFMYQTVGHQTISAYAECMGLPLFRRAIRGTPTVQSLTYTPNKHDEVENLLHLLEDVLLNCPEVNAVSSGAILSNYQRLRVENVCSRLGLTSLAYLWRRDQHDLLQEMIEHRIDAVLVKVAAIGLRPSVHLGRSLVQMQSHLHNLASKYGCNVCGEGGEYETFTLDCPLFKSRIVLDESELMVHSDDAFAPVGFVHIHKYHTVPKSEEEMSVDINLLKGDSSTTTHVYENTIITHDDEYTPHEVDKKNLITSSKLYKCIPFYFPDSCRFSIGIGGMFSFSGISDSTQSTAQDQMEIILKTMQDKLHEMGGGLKCVSFVSLFLSDMSTFQSVNDVYRRYFNVCPASRACVQIHLVSEVKVVLQASGTLHPEAKETLHVQSVSHWAPACIGPYSQATRVAKDSLCWFAGQIALYPPSMTLIQHVECISKEIKQALWNTEQVIHVMQAETSDVVRSICYISHSKKGHNSVENVIDAVEDQYKTWLRKGTDSITLVISPFRHYIGVGALPKGALVEFEMITNPKMDSTEYSEEKEYSVGVKVCTYHDKTNGVKSNSIYTDNTIVVQSWLLSSFKYSCYVDDDSNVGVNVDDATNRDIINKRIFAAHKGLQRVMADSRFSWDDVVNHVYIYYKIDSSSTLLDKLEDELKNATVPKTAIPVFSLHTTDQNTGDIEKADVLYSVVCNIPSKIKH